MFQVASALTLASRLIPVSISAQQLSTTTAILKFTSRVGQLCLMSISDRSPRHSQPMDSRDQDLGWPDRTVARLLCADRLDIRALVEHILPDGLASNRTLPTRV